jgi:enoyl-CoA hydratase/carnithine racemase
MKIPEQIGGTLTRLHGLLRRIAEAPAPTIASVRGQCLGGGLELALACDLILAEETAQLGCPEIQLGVFPPAASALLPVRIGAGPAASLVLSGASVSGVAAAATGLVARTASPGQLDAVLAQWLACRFSASLSFSSTLRGAGRAPSSDACTGTGLAGNRAALLKGPHE